MYFANSFRLLKPYLENINQGKVLDVGCAFGFMLERFPNSFEKFGIDISEYAVAEAKKRVPNASFQVAGTEDPLPFSENSFDVITCNDVLEHVESPRTALKNIHKALKSNGIFISIPQILI
jgi:2-polyprenyl-3-methyl-5-hydroxy-6-metoxy-1,4-benzoquinol methylase